MNRKAACLLEAADRAGRGAVVVEIGCARELAEVPSDGWSTVYLAREAHARGWELHSVDSSPEAVDVARKVTAGFPVEVHHADGAEWLEGFRRPIDLLYLDGAADPAEALAQYEAAMLAQWVVVVVDDVQEFAGHNHGKGDLLLDRLQEDGFDVEVHETEPGYLMAVAR